MQSVKLQIKKRVVYKHKNPTPTNTKNRRDETASENSLPTLLPTGLIL